MQLRRGHILMIAGGAMVAISISMLGYYGLQFVNSIQQEEPLRIEPSGSIKIQQNINATIGAYVVSFPDFDDKAAVTIREPSGKVLINKTIDPPIVIEPFDTQGQGVYTLVLSNPTNRVLEAAVLLDDYETVLSRSNLSSAMYALAFTSVLGIGAAVAVAGAVITFLDLRRINKMKEFGDTSDLV